MLKLDLGCGTFPRGEDYICVDKYAVGIIKYIEDGELKERLAPEYKWLKADLLNLPFADKTIDEIWSSHSLEHIAINKIPDHLREWYRVLKINGKAIIQVPNFDYVARYWFTGPDRAWAEAMIYGLQTNEGEYHRSAFTAQTLKGDLEGVGFEVKNIRYLWNHNQETLQAVAKRIN